MLSERDYKIFTRYEKGDYLDKLHKKDVYDLASIGMACIGFSSEEKETKETAVLTSIGKSILRRERIRKNPIKKYISYIINSIY